MRVKFTIAVCALLMLGLAVTHVNGQGFTVSKSERDVALHGRNQVMGSIRLDYVVTGGNIDDGRTIQVNYGSLGITSTAVTNTGDAFGATLECGGGAGGFGDDCTAAPANITATVANHEDTGVGTVTITIGTENRVAGSFIILRGVRTDTSGLSADDEVIASINSSAAPTGFVPIGQDRSESVGGVVSTVKGGLTVKLVAASRLLCNLTITTLGEGEAAEPVVTAVGGTPSITVTEGFARAFESTTQSGLTAGTHITVKMLNLPKGVSLRWPHVVNFRLDPAEVTVAPELDPIWSALTLTEASRRTAGIVDFGNTEMMGAGQESNAANVAVDAGVGDEVTYMYGTLQAGVTGAILRTVLTEIESFKIEFDVEIPKAADVGAGGISDLWAFLAPAGKTGDADDRGTVLSYNMAPVTDPDSNDGDVLNFTECVTYLLFPYLTCGSDPAWTTAIAISNTTLDDNVFGINDGAEAQNGDIMLHAFPRSAYGEDGMKTMGKPMRTMLTESLAAGDTYSATCSNIIPGFEGYAIAKARFRHAHGLAIILGNFTDGASLDVAHGYLALVIPDPEFNDTGRGANDGESLGQ